MQHPRRHAMLLRKRARLRSARLPATGEVKHLGSTIVLCLHPTPPAQESSQPTSYGTTVFVERYAVAKYFRTGDRANRQPLQCIEGLAPLSHNPVSNGTSIWAATGLRFTNRAT